MALRHLITPLFAASALLPSTTYAAAFPNDNPQAGIHRRNATDAPGGKKAGSASGRPVPFWQDHLGWWYDWTPSPDGDFPGLVPVVMLWGDGNNGPMDKDRFAEFQTLSETPQYLLGFNEPDCGGEDTSADMEVSEGVSIWNDMIAPWGEKGSVLGSPSMCKQKDEDWLQQFNDAADLSRSWDFTAIHVYKPDMDGVKEDIDYYYNTYGKPVWVTEFACVYDQDNFTPCSDQGQINQWISDVVDLFEQDERVSAYAYTDGWGLGDQWPPTNDDGSALSESGQAYLDAISRYS